ncbi:S24 family peptidase [Micavibrio aeruginosavorus]|uniref:S24 family peptidase n=1 Tax=Micavibrio aeruginosavorus TaxID=349221 RepID=UPI003F4A9F31
MPEAQAAVEDANTQGLVTLPVVNLAYFLENEAQGRRGDRTIGYTKFDRAWLDAWYLDPDHICVIPAVGETVEPTIKGGEYILVTQAEEHLKPGDGLYVIRLDGDVLVKRLQRVPGGKLAITSDNPSYKPYEIALDGATDFAILGKVVLVHGVRRV